MPKGEFDLARKPPSLPSNCVPVVGWIQDTLPKFISENKDLKINFVHIDTDTYPTAKNILELIKPFLVHNAIIIFDELCNVVGWSAGEYKALTEVLKEEEIKFLAFSSVGAQAIVQFKSNPSD